MWNDVTTRDPARGEKIVALFKDGSGACLMLRDWSGDYIDENGNLEQFCSERFSIWAKIPSETDLWFESRNKEVAVQ